MESSCGKILSSHSDDCFGYPHMLDVRIYRLRRWLAINISFYLDIIDELLSIIVAGNVCDTQGTEAAGDVTEELDAS